jgi:hypothetical protein
MKTFNTTRLRLYCPGCGKTSTFILIKDETYHCAGDEKQKRIGCGKVLKGN